MSKVGHKPHNCFMVLHPRAHFSASRSSCIDVILFSAYHKMAKIEGEILKWTNQAMAEIKALQQSPTWHHSKSSTLSSSSLMVSCWWPMTLVWIGTIMSTSYSGHWTASICRLWVRTSWTFFSPKAGPYGSLTGLAWVTMPCCYVTLQIIALPFH